MCNTFKNQVIWITGASSGYGHAMSKAFIQAGAKVIISGRNAKLLNQIHQEYPQSTYPLPLDLAQPQTFEVQTAQAIAAFGHIDIMIHNGAIAQNSTALETQPHIARQIMEIDYFSYTELTQYILPHFIERQKGHIIVISGLLARLPLPGRSSYAAAKAALHGYFNCLRQEISAHNIHVTILIPGAMQTALASKALKADGSIAGDTPSHIGMPVELAAQQSLQAILAKNKEAFIGDESGYALWKLASQDPEKAIETFFSKLKASATK